MANTPDLSTIENGGKIMKKGFRILTSTLALLTCLTYAASAEVSFAGQVIASETVAISAPFGGNVDAVNVRVGDPIEVGDPVATLDTTKVYATADGTVSGIFAEEGDDTEGIVTRYGAVLYLEPVNRYKVTATTEKAYNSSTTKYIHIGEKVYLSCTKDGSHTGTAVVTGIADASSGSSGGDSSDSSSSGYTSYTLEVTGGDFYMGETVGIFRDSGYDSTTRIGRGTIEQNSAIAVKGSGSVLKMHVQVGDKVERGELLFETVTGGLDGLYAMDNQILSDVKGIVASVDTQPGSNVDKGAKLITVYPDGSFQIEVLVSELDLNDIHEGDKVNIEFDWDVEGNLRLEGTVASISHVNAGSQSDSSSGSTTASSSGAEYSAYINFEATDEVRLGMSVVVYAANSTNAAQDAGEE